MGRVEEFAIVRQLAIFQPPEPAFGMLVPAGSDYECQSEQPCLSICLTSSANDQEESN